MKVWNYMVIVVGLGVLLTISGIDVIGVSELLQLLGLTPSGGGVSSGGTIFTAVIGILLTATVAGIAIGFITKSQSENYVIVPIITGVATWAGIGSTIFIGYSIINKAFDFAPWIGYIVLTLFAPLIMGFIIALIEFFRGTD